MTTIQLLVNLHSHMGTGESVSVPFIDINGNQATIFGTREIMYRGKDWGRGTYRTFWGWEIEQILWVNCEWLELQQENQVERMECGEAQLDLRGIIGAEQKPSAVETFSNI